MTKFAKAWNRNKLSSSRSYDEHELLARIAKGDERSFYAIFNEYWDRIYANILHICKQPELAEDIAQEVFIRIWLNRSKLPEVAKFDAFLYRISKNLVLDEFRKKVLPSLGDEFFSAYFSSGDIDPLEQIEQKELNNILQKAIEQLPTQMQRVFTMHRFQRLTHQQIAKALKISTVSSQTYMARAIVQLRKILSDLRNDIGLILLFILDR